MGFFYLATLYCAVRALSASTPSRRWWLMAAVTACGLGMGTKEVMVTAPLIVILWDAQFASDRTVRRLPFYLGMGFRWIILAALMAGGGRSSSVGFGFPEWPSWRYLMTQAEVVLHYLRLAIVPTPLVLDYGWPVATSISRVALPGTIIIALVAATLWGLVRRFAAAFAGGWFFVILAPTSSVVPIVTEIAAEHRMYLPVAGVIAFMVIGAYLLGSRLVHATSSRRLAQGAGLSATATVVLLFVAMTRERNLDYRSFDRIWSDTIHRRSRNARTRNNYATALLTSGRFGAPESRRGLRDAGPS